MFDIGFSEIVVIAVVALVVVGPERLPRVARTLGHLFGRMQRYVADVKSDINREIELDELRRLQTTMQDAARDIQQSVSNQVQYVEGQMKQAEQETHKAVESTVSGLNMAGQPAPAASPPAPDSSAPAPAEPTPQLELGLDNQAKGEPRHS